MNYITCREFAEEHGITPEHARSLVRTGKLAGRRFGRQWVIEDGQSMPERKKYTRKTAESHTHHCDNQGLCHHCGIIMEPDWYAHYLGIPLEELENNENNPLNTDRTS